MRLPILIASFTACFSLLVTTSCSTGSAITQKIAQTHSRPGSLSREEAQLRFRQIDHIAYELSVSLNPNSTDFEASSMVSFDLKPKARQLGSSLFLDLEEGTLRTLRINGKLMSDLSSPHRFDSHRIYLQLDELRDKDNQIEIAYSHPYSKDGSGLYRFRDPEDQKLYHFTHFEPYDAHRMFPCFDQPDLKATYHLQVSAPREWEVISNALPDSVIQEGEQKSWKFPKTAPFSTYLFALHAGPYTSWSDHSTDIPLRLFSRASLAKYVDHKEWFEITKQGFNFYNVQFGIPYPFKKYDQIIVPDFNAGAMENVGAVTFAEAYVYRTPVTEDRRAWRAGTILHEMAHMWFGDLVTMKWWNGLWLNESFATFMSFWATDKATRFKGSWQDFFAMEKQWAYWEDQLVTTHPIEVPVPDTDHATANFDGITYGKGASVLKQLMHYLGEEDFSEGVQRYFQKYAYKNTSLSQFIQMLSESSNKDLASWQNSWLQTTGVNSLKAKWSCEIDPDTEKSKIKDFKLIQKEGSELRVHRTQVGLFHLKNGKIVRSESLGVTYKGSETDVPSAIGKPCPEFVYPNDQDYDYVKVELDEQSLTTAREHLAQIEDAFIRQMLWHTLWESVVDGKLSALDYAQVAITHGKHEKNTKVLNKILNTLTADAGVSVLKFLPEQERLEVRSKLDLLMKAELISAPKGSDLQLMAFSAFCRVAHTPNSIHYVKALLDGKAHLKGFKLDQERKWALVQVLAKNNYPMIQDLIQHELKADPSHFGRKFALQAQVLIPTSENKAKWLHYIHGFALSEDRSEYADMTWGTLRSSLAVFHQISQENLIEGSRHAYFDTLPKVALSGKPDLEEYMKFYAGWMFPSTCKQENVDATTKLLQDHPDLPELVVRALKINRQEEERCIRGRKLVETQRSRS